MLELQVIIESAARGLAKAVEEGRGRDALAMLEVVARLREKFAASAVAEAAERAQAQREAMMDVRSNEAGR